jgi:hypothetical protein|tara:strand:- start:3926 stop:4783 length:858 start_codon:yes stop_codon:yes gene_type:complete
MPAVSKKQQRFFGIVRAIQKGEMAATTPETAKAAADMKKSDVKDFASTKHKKLPEKKVAKEEKTFSQKDKIMKKAKPLHKHLFKNLHKGDNSGDVNEESNPRIPRKKGQPANSKKHSDLYTDENPKGTIHGLGFKDVATAKASVSKIRNSSRSHAHKIQAAVAMEQRAREMGKTSEAAVYRKYINSMKKKTKKMNEGWSDKYKKSIDCNNPKGFSQRAHCQGKKKVSEETKYDRYDKEKKEFAKADRKMKFGKFVGKTKEARDRLRPGEVKRYDKKLGRYVSNKE